MNFDTPHPKLNYHTWRDIGGPIGLILDLGFCVFVMIAALARIAFCTVLVFLDYLISPLLALMSRIHLRHADSQ